MTAKPAALFIIDPERINCPRRSNPRGNSVIGLASNDNDYSKVNYIILQTTIQRSVKFFMDKAIGAYLDGVETKGSWLKLLQKQTKLG